MFISPKNIFTFLTFKIYFLKKQVFSRMKRKYQNLDPRKKWLADHASNKIIVFLTLE